jgi:hypothetical protein
MKTPLHLFGLSPAPIQRDNETFHGVATRDVQWNAAVFKAPTLPTPRQLHSELPFSVNFRLKSHGDVNPSDAFNFSLKKLAHAPSVLVN